MKTVRPQQVSQLPILLSVQYARAVAAWLVVVAHLSGFPALFGYTADWGGFGVDIFFVISGFVMWRTQQTQGALAFFAKRLARIAPAYWFYTMLLVFLALLAPALTPRVDIRAPHVLASVLFVPHFNRAGENNPVLLQGWTLNFEMFFYCLLASASFIRIKKIKFATVIGIMVVLTVVGLVLEPSSAVGSAYTSTILLEFGFGMILSQYFRPPGTTPGIFALTILVASLLAVVLSSEYASSSNRFVLLGIPATGILYGLLCCEDIFRRRPSRLLHGLGDSSYSLYLLHPFVLSGVAVVFTRCGIAQYMSATWTGITFAAAGASLSMILAWKSFQLIEIPANRLALGKLKIFKRAVERYRS